MYFLKERKIEVIYSDNNFAKSNLLHEMTHHATNSTLDNVPRWLSEGLADYANFRSGKVIAGQVFPEMLKRIEKAFSDNTFINLEKLTANDDTFLNKESERLAYSESWSLVHYLVASQKLPKYMERFKQGFNKFFNVNII